MSVWGRVSAGRWQNEPARFVYKYPLALLTAVVAFSSYRLVSYLTSTRQHDLMTAVDRAIPFLPWTVWLYLPLFVVFFHLGVYAMRDWRTYMRGLLSILLVCGLAYLGFALVPSSYPRPDLGDDGSLTFALLRYLHTIDPPNNTFPSLHVGMTLCVAFACARDNQRWGLWLGVLALGPVLSILTTKQHYVVDLVGGAVMAIVAHLMVFGRPAWLAQSAAPQASRAP